MGRVQEVHRKPERPGEHGLPKPAVEEIQIGPGGVTGDFNRYRHEELADEPTSAVLLIPSETLRELRNEGWPVRPGDLGENVTTEGIAYDAMPPGTLLRFARGPEVEITRPCDPCTNLYLLPYVGEAQGPKFVKTMLHRRGWYARVRVPGAIRPGDRIEIVPGAGGGAGAP
jgi:MOSC domain-containing protein YiiM